jgi:hypothetical protein
MGAAIAIAYAQQQDPVGLTDFPVPAWPKDGKVPAELKDKYVFIDTDKNEYVVAYPENLPVTETPAAKEAYQKDGPGPLRIGHYPLLRNVDPAVVLTVTATGGKYKYAYNVADGPKAKQSIDQWIIVIPEQAADADIKSPAGWFAVLQGDRMFKVKNPGWIKNGAAAVWSFEKAEQVIQPGGALTGFELDTDLRPGFTLAYFRKAETVDAQVAASGCGVSSNCAGIPKPVRDQLDPLLQVEYNSKTIVTLGPKFDKSADDKAVAADFIEGITTLSHAGGLDPNSDFVKNALMELKNTQSSGASPKLTAPAKTPVETEILAAMKISLRAM